MKLKDQKRIIVLFDARFILLWDIRKALHYLDTFFI